MLSAMHTAKAAHRIVFWRETEQLAVVSWSLGLEAAKAHARFYLRLARATRVEVLDAGANTVVYECRAEK
jgi:hypothetical protein